MIGIINEKYIKVYLRKCDKNIKNTLDGMILNQIIKQNI
jgi:hypothetical protein